MKKITAALLALLTLTAAGCQKKEQEDSGAPDYTLIIQDSIDEETTSAAQATEVPFETVNTTEEETTTTDPISTETAPSETENSASEESATEAEPQETETFTAGETDEALLGNWEYENGFRLQLMEENMMTMFVDYTIAMGFEDGYFSVGDIECAVSADAAGVTAVYEGETILHMTPVSGTNSVSLQGLYYLEDCYVLDSVAGVPTETYYILLEDEKLFLGTTGFYNASDGEMLLYSAGDILTLQYELHENALVIIDENGQTDVLTKMN